MSGVDFWSRHLAAVEAQDVSINAYAKREGLSAVSLYYWRKRLGLRSARQRAVVASQFVSVELEQPAHRAGPCQLVLGDGVRLEFSQLPSAHWVADFARAYQRQGT